MSLSQKTRERARVKNVKRTGLTIRRTNLLRGSGIFHHRKLARNLVDGQESRSGEEKVQLCTARESK